MSESENLENKKSDWAVSVAKGAIGAVPFVGGLLAEVVGGVIPNQRMDRIANYVGQLEGKLADLDKGLVRQRLTSPEVVDLLEDSFFLAARALVEERRAQIAEVVKQGVVESKAKVYQCKRVLQVLADVTDFELMLLRAYALEWKHEHPFVAANLEKLRGPRAYIGAPQELIDAYVLHEGYKTNLSRLGLLAPQYDHDLETETPKIDRFTGGLKLVGYNITPLGKLVVDTIDGYPDNPFA